MNDGEKPSRRSSGMYFLKVRNQVASEGEERSEARPLGELGRKSEGTGSWKEKSETTGGSWEEKSETTGGKRRIENM